VTPPTLQTRQSKAAAVVRVALGNSIEMYDFQIFGYYAPAIALAFFPSGSAFAGLMLSLMTFGTAFSCVPSVRFCSVRTSIITDAAPVCC
jgi:hypothetical protein